MKLLEIAENFKNSSTENEAIWDYMSGEEVCGLLINKNLVAYIHEKVPICFCSSDFEKYKNVYSDVLWFVATDDFHKDEWFVDLSELQEAAPELQWLASGVGRKKGETQNKICLQMACVYIIVFSAPNDPIWEAN